MIVDWEIKNFIECLSPARIDRGKQVKARDYLIEGSYPIVDQGQSEIAGWTNNDSLVIRNGLPYIIFGDHTRILKYID